MPGRLVGQTVDKNGKRGFVLTLATREQHIRREKATSNICTNQALVALMVNIFMTVYGKVGLKEVGEAESGEGGIRGRAVREHAKVLFAGAPRFNEFVVETSEDPYAINAAAGTQNRRRIATEEVLSRTWTCGSVVLHGADHADR
jgi:glycine dehydrogenase subunit 1